MQVRSGENRHHASVLDIARALPGYFDAPGLQKIERDLAVHRLRVGLCEGAVEGFLLCEQERQEVSEILWMAVAPAWQGKGLGSSLIADAAEILKLRGVRFVVVKTLAPIVDYPPYELTRRFYERNGFVLVEVVDPYPPWGEGNPCAIYVKSLSEKA